ncbi:MAG: hypothetical protein ACYDHX_04140 [Methanothrix sp.]
MAGLAVGCVLVELDRGHKSWAGDGCTPGGPGCARRLRLRSRWLVSLAGLELQVLRGCGLGGAGFGEFSFTAPELNAALEVEDSEISSVIRPLDQKERGFIPLLDRKSRLSCSESCIEKD